MYLSAGRGSSPRCPYFNNMPYTSGTAEKLVASNRRNASTIEDGNVNRSMRGVEPAGFEVGKFGLRIRGRNGGTAMDRPSPQLASPRGMRPALATRFRCWAM